MISLNEGGINWERMASLTGQPVRVLQAELAGLVFETPEGRWVTADDYLSGDVKSKLRNAQAAAKLQPRFEANVDALLAVQPAPLKPSEIYVGFGAGWVPPAVMSDFTHHIFKRRVGLSYIAEMGEWVMDKDDASGVRWSHQNTTAWGTPGADALKLINDGLNNRQTTVYKEVPHDYLPNETKRVVDQEATLLARQKQEEIKTEFQDWIWADSARSQQLADLYNDKFNRIVPRSYDGSHLTFPGMNPAFDLRHYQKNAVWRVLQGDNTLLAHMVGAGKTFTMIAANMELRRMGVRNKIMHVLPKNVVDQYAEEFQRLYPGARVLVIGAGDMTPSRRQRTLSRVMTEDWDAVLTTHSSFEKMPVSDELYVNYLRKEIAALERAIAARSSAENSYGYRARKKDPSVKEIEKAKKKLEAQLEKRLKRGSKDGGLRFDELGVDHIFVDEAHAYKNLYTSTKMTRVAGVKANSGSNRAQDMYMKTQYLANRCQCGRFVSPSGVCQRCLHKTEVVQGGITFATGTPVANSVGEIYNMQRYLQPDALEQQDLGHFDAWASMYGDMVTAIEMKPSGQGFRSFTRFAKFRNVPELLRAFGQVADFQMDPNAMNLNRPLLSGGGEQELYEQARQAFLDFAGAEALTAKDRLAPGYEHLEESQEYLSWVHARNDYRRAVPVSVELSPFQRDVIEECGRRAESIAGVDPRKDNMLKVVHDARTVSLDQRLHNPNLPDDPGSKLNAAVASMLDIYRENPATAQMIFLDMATPGAGNERIGTLSYWRNPERLLKRLESKGALPVAGSQVGRRVTEHKLAGPEAESEARGVAEAFVAEQLDDIVNASTIAAVETRYDADGRKQYVAYIKNGHGRCEKCQSFVSPGKPCQRCARIEAKLQEVLPAEAVEEVKAMLDERIEAIAPDEITSTLNTFHGQGAVREMITASYIAQLNQLWQQHTGQAAGEEKQVQWQQTADVMTQYMANSLTDKEDMAARGEEAAGSASGDATTREVAVNTADSLTEKIAEKGLVDTAAANFGGSDSDPRGHYTTLTIAAGEDGDEALVAAANRFVEQLTGQPAWVTAIADERDIRGTTERHLHIRPPDDVESGSLAEALEAELAAEGLDAYARVTMVGESKVILSVRGPLSLYREQTSITVDGGAEPTARAEAVRKALAEIGLPESRFGQPVQNVTVGEDGRVVIDLHQVQIPHGSKLDLYDDMKVKLIAAGVPEEEIAFIHEANSDAQKLEMFQKMNEGGLSFLFGSTGKMGTGTNAQKRLKALHHLDAPWRPDEVEQREGRIIRHGNQNQEVGVYRYVTEESFDVFMWQTLERKAGFIQQVTRGDLNTREMEDIGDAQSDFATMRAVATGNPAVLELVEVEAQLKKMEALERGHFDKITGLRWRLQSMPKDMDKLRQEIARYEAAEAVIEWPTKGKFAMSVQGQTITKQLDAGNALADMIAKKDAETRGRDFTLSNVGNLYGLPLSIEQTGGKTYAVLQAGPVQVPVEVTGSNGAGMIQRLKNQVDKLPQARHEKEAELADLEERLPKVQAIVDAGFEHAEELDQLRSRAEELRQVVEASGANKNGEQVFDGIEDGDDEDDVTAGEEQD
jgi:hypothetical protein